EDGGDEREHRARGVPRHRPCGPRGVPAGRDPDRRRLLRARPRSGMTSVADANCEAIARVLASEPWLVGIRPAGEVVPRMTPSLVLHAAPPASWDELSPVLRGGIEGAAALEGIQPSAVELGAA